MKKQTMYIRMITASLARRRSRMVIALLAIIVGATVLAGMVTIYYDLPNQMGMQFRNYGANMILVPANDEDGLSQETIDAALESVDEDDLVGAAPYHYENMTINSVSMIAAATDLASVQETSPYWYVTGSWPSESGEILVGIEEADTFGLAVGDVVTLTYEPEDSDEEITKDFTVVGTLDTGGSEEEYFYMSQEDMAEMLGSDMLYDLCELSIQASEDKLDEYVDIIESENESVNAQLVKRLAESESTVLAKLQALILIVTVIVLALTMICVATTMTAVIAERRREVGLRKALGASDGSLMMEFMGEGLLLGFFGGLIGSGFGFAFAQIVSTSVFNSSITFRPYLIPLSIVVALVVTAIACILPVRNATKIDPAIVLSGE